MKNEAMQKKRTPSLTDQRLRQLLKQLREEPAAPQDFRDKVLARLEHDGVLPRRAPSMPVASWTQRLQALWRPAGLGLAAAGALALLLVLRPVAPVLAPAFAPAAQTAAVAAPKGKPFAAAHPAAFRVAVKATAVAAPAAVEHNFETAPQDAAAAPALGAAAAPTTVPQAVHASGVTTTPVVTQGKPVLQAYSQVRNNVIRASRGGAPATVHFYLATPGHVHVEVMDRVGHLVSVLFDGDLVAGAYDGTSPVITWSGTADSGGMAASGIYLLRIQAPDFTNTHKLMLVK
jgi:hypothetical protein